MAEENTDVEVAASGIPGLPADWAQQGTNKVIDLVDNVRTKTAGPAINISRKVVYGLVAGVLALFMLPLVIIFLIRLLESALDIWMIYMILGVLFTVGGMLIWRMRPRGVAGT